MRCEKSDIFFYFQTKKCRMSTCQAGLAPAPDRHRRVKFESFTHGVPLAVPAPALPGVSFSYTHGDAGPGVFLGFQNTPG